MKNQVSEALWNIRAAMLLFFIDVNILGFDIIPDFVGWICMLGAITILEEVSPGIVRIRTFGKVLLWYEMAMVVLYYISDRVPFYEEAIPFVSLFILCIRMYFIYIILTAAGDAAARMGGEAETLRKLGRDRNGILVVELVLYPATAIQGTEQIGGWIWLPFAAYFLFYISCILRLTFLMEEIAAWEKRQEEAVLEPKEQN